MNLTPGTILAIQTGQWVPFWIPFVLTFDTYEATWPGVHSGAGFCRPST